MSTDSIKYRREFVGVFNQSVSLLKSRTLEESMVEGRSAVFDITAIGGRMQKRSIDGRIPRTNSNDSQVTATLEEFVKKFEVTDFEAFTSQSDERAKMNHKIMESVNQEYDFVLLNELANASNQYSGSAAAITLDLATKVIATLANNSVPITPENVTWTISPFMEAKLQTIAGYTSADYVDVKVLSKGGNQYTGEAKAKVWLNVAWVVHPNLLNAGTADCATYIWHKRAIGSAVPTSQMRYAAGYDDQDHFHYCSATAKLNAKILQQAGLLKYRHNDTA